MLTRWGWWSWKFLLLHLGCKSLGLEHTVVLKGYSENRYNKMMWHYQREAVLCTKFWFVMDHYVSSLKRNICFYPDMASFFPFSLSEVRVHFTATCYLLFVYCLHYHRCPKPSLSFAHLYPALALPSLWPTPHYLLSVSNKIYWELVLPLQSVLLATAPVKATIYLSRAVLVVS